MAGDELNEFESLLALVEEARAKTEAALLQAEDRLITLRPKCLLVEWHRVGTLQVVGTLLTTALDTLMRACKLCQQARAEAKRESSSARRERICY